MDGKTSTNLYGLIYSPLPEIVRFKPPQMDSNGSIPNGYGKKQSMIK
jgi:hypothetical protein